jgi:[acyl-carrier-protein] S-malonyltransferase
MSHAGSAGADPLVTPDTMLACTDAADYHGLMRGRPSTAAGSARSPYDDLPKPLRPPGGAPLIALLFPGQGVQQVGMGSALAETFPTARRTFDEANDVLGFDLARLCFEGPEERLMSTRVCQPAVLTTSVAAWRVAEENGITGDMTLGHSLGEYAALVASRSISFETALQLVQARGDATTEVVARSPGSMAALLGASDEDVEALCIEAGEVWPANYNCPGQVVASGLRGGVDRLLDLARSRGIKARLLDIDGAFHSSVMAPATDKLRDALSGVKICAPSLPFLSATTAAFERRGDQVRTILAQQLTAPVRFTQSVRIALDHGIEGFVEFGPRRVLVGLVRRIRPDVKTLHLGEPADLPPLLAFAARG